MPAGTHRAAAPGSFQPPPTQPAVRRLAPGNLHFAATNCRSVAAGVTAEVADSTVEATLLQVNP